MGHILPSDREVEIDLEKGIVISNESEGLDPGSCENLLSKKTTDNICPRSLSVDSSLNEALAKPNACKVSAAMTKGLEGNTKVNIDEKKLGKEKRKPTTAKKPPKPPRPPRGFSLDPADQKLVKEIAELAIIKRARIERLKALKKMKTARATSSIGNFVAMLFTVLFCMVILFQGISSKGSTNNSKVSLEMAQSTGDDFVLSHTLLNRSARNSVLPDPAPTNVLEHASGSESADLPSRAVG